MILKSKFYFWNKQTRNLFSRFSMKLFWQKKQTGTQFWSEWKIDNSDFSHFFPSKFGGQHFNSSRNFLKPPKTNIKMKKQYVDLKWPHSSSIWNDFRKKKNCFFSRTFCWKIVWPSSKTKPKNCDNFHTNTRAWSNGF